MSSGFGMTTATELHTVSEFYYAHLIAILFTK